MPSNTENSRLLMRVFYSLKACSKATAAAVVVFVIALTGINAQADPIIFDINYTGSEWTDESKDALQYAADIWGSLLTSNYPGETITIEAIFDSSLPAGALAGGLHYASQSTAYQGGAAFGQLAPDFFGQAGFFPVATAATDNSDDGLFFGHAYMDYSTRKRGLKTVFDVIEVFFTPPHLVVRRSYCPTLPTL